ncbi:hypothetical protein F4561_000523 [Lipingzhangella halophila]|uniref:Secreted protein n=1 Tax=Lipingzhangella halophila TaxID=1783352 RepID=A0A7W7RCZ3_9ACTN|nr:hypothetical protein [Lipingzhangella halophila]MBB4929703.1 hypothetical protein [Lipingzhangella halophila]
MVTTIPRVLASLAVAAVIMLGVPMPPFAAVLTSSSTQDVPGVADGGSDEHALASAKRTPTTVALALPATSNGDLRQAVRDLPDEYTPAHTALPEIGGPWGYTPLPESVAEPDLAEPFALPLGRAPPLTAGA